MSGGPEGVFVERHLLPDPALDWLRRAHGGLGIWIAEIDPEEEGPRAERLVDSERLTVAQIVAVDRRLEVARDRDETGVEMMDGGLLVFRAERGVAAGLLLPLGFGAGDGGATRMAQVDSDMRHLLEGLQRRPQVIALAQARTREASFESVASVAFRLAYQIGRMLGAHGLRSDVIVAMSESSGVRIVGISGRADRRLLDGVVPRESALARVARGGAEMEVGVTADPLGGFLVDRREQGGAAHLVPIRTERRSIGAVLIRLAPGDVLIGAARVELGEALADAGPRLLRALEAGLTQQGVTTDTLTGLLDRRGFAAVVERRASRKGALIVLDMERLEILNNALSEGGGDAALAHIAQLLRAQVRGDDVPARLEGGAFAIWLPEAEAELGARVAERIRAAIGMTSWDWRGRRWPLAALFGVAARGEGEETLESIMEQAHNALAVAKRGGRDRVESGA